MERGLLPTECANSLWQNHSRPLLGSARRHTQAYNLKAPSERIAQACSFSRPAANQPVGCWRVSRGFTSSPAHSQPACGPASCASTLPAVRCGGRCAPVQDLSKHLGGGRTDGLGSIDQPGRRPLQMLLMRLGAVLVDRRLPIGFVAAHMRGDPLPQWKTSTVRTAKRTSTCRPTS